MSYAPDFGLFMANQLKSKGLVFKPFKFYHVSVLSEGAYSTLANIKWGETTYAVSIDFDQARYEQLLKALPKTVAETLQRRLQEGVDFPTMIELPKPYEIGVRTKLGTLTKDKVKVEFIPFIATEIFPFGGVYSDGDTTMCSSCGKAITVRYYAPDLAIYAKHDAVQNYALKCQDCGRILCVSCATPPGRGGIVVLPFL